MKLEMEIGKIVESTKNVEYFTISPCRFHISQRFSGMSFDKLRNLMAGEIPLQEPFEEQILVRKVCDHTAALTEFIFFVPIMVFRGLEQSQAKQIAIVWNESNLRHQPFEEVQT